MALCCACSAFFIASVARAVETPAQRTSEPDRPERAPVDDTPETLTMVDSVPAQPARDMPTDNEPVDNAPVDGNAIAIDAVQEIGPPERIRAHETFPADAPPGRLVIYRNRTKPAWRTPKVSVDGGRAFRPKPNTYTELALPPGLHRVRVDWAADTLRPDVVFDIRIAPGRIDYVRLTGTYTSIHPNQFRLATYAEWVEPDIAAAELGACCRRLRAP